MYDAHPERLYSPGLEQDFDTQQSDLFGVVFVTFLDRQNSIMFGVSPAGALYDAQSFNDSREVNRSWEGVVEFRPLYAHQSRLTAKAGGALEPACRARTMVTIAARIILSYYLATPLFLLIDLLWHALLRVAFIQSHGMRVAYYGFCFLCGLVMWRKRLFAPALGMLESAVNSFPCQGEDAATDCGTKQRDKTSGRGSCGCGSQHLPHQPLKRFAGSARFITWQ